MKARKNARAHTHKHTFHSYTSTGQLSTTKRKWPMFCHCWKKCGTNANYLFRFCLLAYRFYCGIPTKSRGTYWKWKSKLWNQQLTSYWKLHWIRISAKWTDSFKYLRAMADVIIGDIIYGESIEFEKKSKFGCMCDIIWQWCHHHWRFEEIRMRCTRSVIGVCLCVWNFYVDRLAAFSYCCHRYLCHITGCVIVVRFLVVSLLLLFTIDTICDKNGKSKLIVPIKYIV